MGDGNPCPAGGDKGRHHRLDVPAVLGRRVLGDRHDNLNGDYLSDACAAQVGVSAWRRRNIGDEAAIFEATHGTAPKYAGQDKVNGFLILSAASCLNTLAGWKPPISSLGHDGRHRPRLRHLRSRAPDGRVDLVSCSRFGGYRRACSQVLASTVGRLRPILIDPLALFLLRGHTLRHERTIPYLHKVQYYETDQMGVVHHSNYIRWFEDARTDLLERAGLGYDTMEERGIVVPVLAVSCEYKTSVRYGESVAIIPTVEAYTGLRLTISYRIVDAGTGETRATGETRHAFLDRDFSLRPEARPPRRG